MLKLKDKNIGTTEFSTVLVYFFSDSPIFEGKEGRGKPRYPIEKKILVLGLWGEVNLP